MAILPGLVNAHTHLELSDVSTPLGQPGMGLVDWIRLVIGHRRRSGMPRHEAVAMGLRESLALGVTTLGEIAQPDASIAAYDDWPGDVTIFMELLAPTVERVSGAVELARRHLALIEKSGRFFGLSPHAPYSVQPALLRQAVALSAEHRAALSFHLAESREEIEWLRTGGGPFRAMLESLGAR